MQASGHWDVVIESPLGQQRRTMEIEAQGESFKADVTGPDGTHSINGKINGSQLTWTDQVTSPMKLTLHFDVVVEGDEMKGLVKLGIFGKAKFFAKRL